LALAGATIAVLSAAVWLVRDTRDVVTSLGPAEGSLVVNLNTASEDELISVPGIGPTRAAQVIAGRPYASVDELEKIAGIAGKTLESLRPFVSVDGETRPRD
jgi:competence protein ComEA